MIYNTIGWLLISVAALNNHLLAQAVEEAPPALAGEKSVKPGINEGFLNPDLDVDQMVERFEMESREIFVARERILAGCGIDKGDEVADVGAGTGLFSRMFAIETGDDGWVFAVDIAPRLVKHITEEATRLELGNITGVLCAENSVNLPPNSVDVVFICDTYHHFEYPASTMGSVHRALRPGGHLIVVDFKRIPGESREWILGHVRAGKSVVRDEIEEAGFELVEELDIDGLQENYFLKFRKN